MSYLSGWENFYQEVNQADVNINLAKASLYYAQSEYEDLEPQLYLNTLDKIADEISKRLQQNPYPLQVIKTINQYLFTELGFRGNQKDYYDPRNSFLNQVIERRIGIPITLSLLYLEIAKRLDFTMLGIGMPGHFLIRPDFEDAAIFVDAFNGGEILFEQDCELRLQQIYQKSIKLEPQFLRPVSNRQILARMLSNLKYIYLNRDQLTKVLATVEAILILFPDNPLEIRDRGLLYYQFDEREEAKQDLETYLAMLPNATDAVTIRQLLDKIS